MSLNVKEIFYSLQGEGGRQGEASIFIRLAGCNLRCAFCDTDFSDGTAMKLDEILSVIRQYPCLWLIWTGGEPALQLTAEDIVYFKQKGYFQAIESNGHYSLPNGLDYTVVSPKGNIKYAAKINHLIDEIRLPVEIGDKLPDINILPHAKLYFISPIFSEKKKTQKNIDYCVELVKQNPQWRLSLQMHKLIGIE
ncbi:MAG: 7-carboxy-7-deazaguanine synthase QueE [Dysgonamonadaceae bacterium]|jgi:organic radical activating enzyme|nr:7-carboxy-7-deazaguanine synthase QueE [Dysgonamonadaceae bacterium]